MAIDFPNSPFNGMIYTEGGKSWIWDGTVWKAYGASLSPTVLKVDSTNTRVGINNQSPAYTLDVNGTVEATQFIQGTDYLSPFHGYRNAIINGGFDVWQRSTFNYLYTFAYYPAADRWIGSTVSVANTTTMERQNLAVGGISGYDGQYFMGSFNNINYPNIFSQRIEDVRTFAGQTVTLSYWVNNFGYGNNVIVSSLTQNFGSGGSTAVTTNFSNVATTSSWVRVSQTLTLPSISGKTVGANSYLQLTLNTNGHYYVGITGVQLELGSVATPFERRSPGVELALCQRYFEKTYRQSDAPGSNTTNGFAQYAGTSNGASSMVFRVQFAVQKRYSSYTMTFYRTNGTSGSWDVAYNGGTTTPVVTSDNFSEAGCRGYVAIGGGNFVACNTSGHWTCDSEL